MLSISVTVPVYEKRDGGERNYKKIDVCLYCEKEMKSKISVHYLSVHITETRVAAIALLPVKSKERKKQLARLQIDGNTQHNYRVCIHFLGSKSYLYNIGVMALIFYLIYRRHVSVNVLYQQCNSVLQWQNFCVYFIIHMYILLWYDRKIIFNAITLSHQVIERGEGELIVSRRPTTPVGAHEFSPCEYCTAFYLRTTLWKHIQQCQFRPEEDQPTHNYVRNSMTMLSPFLKRDVQETDAVLNTLWTGMKETAQNPNIPRICKNDDIIVEFARSKLDRLGTVDEQRKNDMYNVSTKVRTVGRLLKKLNAGNDNWKPLRDFLTGPGFRLVVEGVKGLAIDSDSPQIALVLSRYIKQCALLKLSMGIQSQDKIAQDDAKDFDFLYQTHWNNRVSCVALRRQRLRRINAPSNIPYTSDIVGLTTWLKTQITTLLKSSVFSSSEWRWFAQIVLVRVVLFNRRRISEVEEIKYSDFDRRLCMEDTDTEDVIQSLGVTEKALAER